ncbi:MULTISPECIES: hypothetical protein [unclassified Pseudomonas]|uniref:hypothetical protein n=1 Tax=unclassified Pseudomonas TaxID=196821 RepID=UPI000C883377|nr:MULTISPECIES: hypothetical protein [unclassified Pseudomonas]PNA02999.1 hypothetical protein C1X79_00620 [Pseudomonas sp. FW305-42]PNA27785.1 hypothetical protein C1X78_02365 [Pseudomonas sp. MPR-R1B]PNB29771.1 hypothetical protein C1X80_00800 [Pseudomonas sp. DP16D-E2]PNB45329.1 hypothetical protein C1X75_02715 [Pseudomonas sp. FW305-17]PNB63692.1 hypothetical protein C1X77_06090 [Pseudomonas sp. GW531-E2]
MHRLVIEVDGQLLQLLEREAKVHHLSLEGECLRRLQGGEGHSPYLLALLAELRADDEQRRARDSDQRA